MKTKPVQLKQPEKNVSATKLIQTLKAKNKTSNIYLYIFLKNILLY